MEINRIPFRLAILGGGIFAQERHAPAIRQLIDAKIVVVKVVYSRSQSSAESMAKLLQQDFKDGILISFGDFDEVVPHILKRDDIDGVDVVLPILYLAKTVRLCLELGKHVFSEKPIAENIKVAKELLNLYKEKKKVNPNLSWAVDENWRHTPSFRKAAEIVAGGEIGRPLLAIFESRASMTSTNKYFNTDWRKNPDYQGGFLLDGGVHYVAGMRLVVGEIAQITSQVTQLQPHLPPCDTFAASIKFKNGVVGSCMVTFGAAKSGFTTLTVHGENGVLKVGRSELEVTQYSNNTTTSPSFPKDFEIAPIKESFELWIQCGVGEKVDGKFKTANGHWLNSPEEALEDLSVMESILNGSSNSN